MSQGAYYRTGSTYALAWPATAGAFGDQPAVSYGGSCLRSCSSLDAPLVVAPKPPMWRRRTTAPLKLIYSWQELGQRSVITGDFRRFTFPFVCRSPEDLPRKPASSRYGTAPERSSRRAFPPRALERTVTYGMPACEPEYVQLGGRFIGVRPPANGSMVRRGQRRAWMHVASPQPAPAPAPLVSRQPALPGRLIPANQAPAAQRQLPPLAVAPQTQPAPRVMTWTRIAR